MAIVGGSRAEPSDLAVVRFSLDASVGRRVRLRLRKVFSLA